MIEFLLVAVLVLQSRWQLLFDYACDRFIEIEDPDDWEGREDEWCEAQMEWACNFADERCDDDDALLQHTDMLFDDLYQAYLAGDPGRE